jgi:hypothetical protein
VNCYRVRSWQRRAETVTRKLDDLLDDIRREMQPTTGVELAITNQLSRLVDEGDMLVCNLDALAAEVSR